MRRPILVVAMLLAVVSVGCTSPTSPSAALSVVVTPNPLRVPQESVLRYDVTVTAPTTVGVRIDRMETRVLGNTGTTYLHSIRHVSRSGGCQSCTADEMISAGSTTTWRGERGTFVNGQPMPGTFEFVVYATDGNGNPLVARVELPVVP
jgi:hypothetical protein